MSHILQQLSKKNRRLHEAAPYSPAPEADSSAGLFENMMEGFALCEIVCNHDGQPCDFRYIDVNAAFESIIGLKREEVVGKTARELFPGIEPMWLEVYSKVALQGIPSRFDAWFDSRKRHLEVSAYSPSKGRFAAIFLDVTERKRADEQLRVLSRAVEQSPVSVMITDAKGNIEYVNPKFTQASGYGFAEVVGQNPRILKSGDFSRENYEELWSTVKSGREWHGEFHNKRKNSDPYWELASISPITDQAGAITHFVAVKEDITERKRIEKELRRSQSKLRLALTLAKVVYWERDVATRMYRFDDDFYALYGTSVEKEGGYEMSAETYIRRFIPPKDIARVEASISADLANCDPQYESRLEHRIIRGDGEERTVAVVIRVVKDATGRAIKKYGAIQDITERRQAEESLQLFRTLIDHSDDGIEVIDPETAQYLDINQIACGRLGYTREEMLSMKVYDIETTLNNAASWPAHAEKLRLTGSFIGEGTHRRKDGSTFPVEVNVHYLQHDRGYLVAVVRDITERKRVEDALRESEARFRTICETSPLGIFMMDENRNVTYVNRSACEITGRSIEDLGGQGWREMIYQEDRQHVSDQWDTAARTQTAFHGARRYLRKDEKVIWANMTCAPILEKHAIRGYMGIFEDITEQKQKDEQLLRSQRMESVGTLAGGIAHDLNNALGPILMVVDILKRQITDDTNLRLLDVMEASAQHGADLVRQVLSFARGVHGQSILVNLVHLLDQIGNMIHDTFPKNIDFRFAHCADPWMVTGDPTHLHQVFTNLCVNARDAMPRGGALKVVLENKVLDDVYAGMNLDSKAGAYLVVKVEDNGCGIPAAVADRIFEPFFTTKDVGKGTGLGLSTTMAIVKSHGGFINVYSEVGTGTTFAVYLPANASSRAVKDLAIEETALIRGNGETVLFVDDEERIRTVAQTLLEGFGYRVLLATNGAEAVGLYAQHREQIAIVLTDMAMPIMDGPSTIIALKALNPNVKVIGSSGLDTNGAIAEAVGAGVKHFIPKPYTAQTMLKILSLALREG